MATLTTFTAGTPILSADVNANFAALNTAAAQTGYTTLTQVTNILTGEDLLHSWAMPANTLTAAGDGYMIRSSVAFEANGNTKTLRFYPSRTASGTGGTGIVLNPTTAAPNAKYADINIVAIYSGSGALSYSATVIMGVVAGTGGNLEYAAGASNSPVAHVEGSVAYVEFTGQATLTADITQYFTVITIFKAAP